MNKELEKLRDELSTTHGELRAEEAELTVLRDQTAKVIRVLEEQAAKSLGAVEAQERKVETIRDKINAIEDEIIHLS